MLRKEDSGEAIAKSMFEMSKIKVPIITVVIGEGSSGGALAISIGNKIIMLENAIYSILSPEGYASILWKDSSRAKEAAEKMKLTAKDLYDFKIIDKIIKEGNRSKKNINDKTNNSTINSKIEENDFKLTAQSIKKEIIKSLRELEKLSKEELVEQRYNKFRIQPFGINNFG